jgi:predicted RNA binding protein YcfA (HicA-like mRNA interferase family)
MSVLANHSCNDVCVVLQSVGFIFDRDNGHMVYIRKEPPPFRRAVIPKHREIKKGTLRRIIRDAGMTVDEFVSVLSKV